MEKDAAAKSPSIRFLRVGIVVRDMEKTIEYLSSLGIGPFESFPPPDFAELLFRGKPCTLDLKACITKIGGLEIELIQPASGQSPQQEFLDSKGEGIQFIVFAVDDLDEAVESFTKSGISLLLYGKTKDGGGFAYLSIDAVGGIMVELFQK
jgi:methylmalonyl-CoA/ethylmalonyl-CoA epimerase